MLQTGEWNKIGPYDLDDNEMNETAEVISPSQCLFANFS